MKVSYHSRTEEDGTPGLARREHGCHLLARVAALHTGAQEALKDSRSLSV